MQWAIKGEVSASGLKAWREEREKMQRGEGTADAVLASGPPPSPQTKNQAFCVLHEGYEEYADIRWVIVCNNCWTAMMALVEQAQKGLQDDTRGSEIGEAS